MNRPLKFRAWDRYSFPNRMVTPKDGDFIGWHAPSNWEKCYWVMQYTGLNDKANKEIFVGDILSERWKVEVYQNKEGTYMVKFHTAPAKNKPRSLFKYLESRVKAGTSDTDCIVIGNIYENPNLI